ncbi:MAG: NADPH-dependent glutamate synthase [Dehalococcoidales bacterium]|nr:NADPH-dependent glutamate synthase [Dehalococcoidales bacterium]
MAKINLNRESMPRQDPKVRAKNFNEVALGYSAEQAKAEASRCIQCPKHPCVGGCPVDIDIPGFIKAIRDDNMPEAVRILKSKNSLPGICGRVCPQETQCEAECTLDKKGAPIAIGRLERYVADWERANMSSAASSVTPPKPDGYKVAVVGSGPAGLTAAADLAKLGHRVTLFEALHVAGGVLMYGIPEFRLPKEIVRAEVDYVASLGVEIILDTVVGKTTGVDEILNNGYRAVFLGPGAGAPMFLNITGENLNGVYSANEFLTRVNLMKAYRFPEYDTPVRVGKRVGVVGGGNVAMDAARCALRLGAEEVYIVYRRSEVEMPARREEVENAKEEGIQFRLLTNPKQFIGNDQNWVAGMECYEMELGEPDASGRRRPIAIPGSEFILKVDVAIAALGTRPNPIIPSTTEGLMTSRWGTIIADEVSGRTEKPAVWAGGDIVTGSATVISAMGAGKRAAADIDKALRG